MSEDVAVVAVDPAIKKNGVAYSLFDDGVKGTTTMPISEVGVFLNGISAPRIVLLVEKPREGKGRRDGHTYSLQPVLSAKKQWIEAVERRWAKKERMVYEISTEEWRPIILGTGRRTKREDWKTIACQLTGLKDHNEAEAACLLRYWQKFLQANARLPWRT